MSAKIEKMQKKIIDLREYKVNFKVDFFLKMY